MNNNDGMNGTSEGTMMTRPVGILVPEETRLSGKLYADRPEGLDQYGGGESERAIVNFG